MDFTQKIYFDDKPLILTTNATSYRTIHAEAAGYKVLAKDNSVMLEQGFESLTDNSVQGVIVEGESKEQLQEKLYELFEPVHAGGGVVKNEEGAILLIYRRGKWDLPKGKLDEGETIEECSLREVIEETGLKRVSLGEKICDTYHIYKQKGNYYLKCTAWYHMTGTKEDVLEPQEEEKIEDVRWVSESGLPELLKDTYEGIKDVLRLAGINY